MPVNSIAYETRLVRVVVALLLGATALECSTALAQPRPRIPLNTEAMRRAQATVLRQKLANSSPADESFWADVKRLESLYPPDVRIAVVNHPGATMLYSYKNVNGRAVAEDHIDLGDFSVVQGEQALARGDVPAMAAAAVVNRDRATWWPDATVPFEIDQPLKDSPAAQGAIDDVMAEYQALTPVRFRARDGDRQYLRINRHLLGLASMTHSVGANGGETKIDLQTEGPTGPLSREELAASLRHEMGHALGMYHEHSRKDRDEFVFVDTECDSYDFWYGISGNYSIEDNSTNIGPYDFLSVMHYGSIPGHKGPLDNRQSCFNVSKRPEKREEGETGEIFGNAFLSKHDINALHHMYGRAGRRGRAGDAYGSQLLVHNFDPRIPAGSPTRDDYPDLAVGAPGLWGGAGGVYLYKNTAKGLVLWKFITASRDEAGQRFGESLAAGDFDGDGIQELAVGAPRATVNGKAAAGKVFIFRIRGDAAVDEIEIVTKEGFSDPVEVMDRFGAALATGFFLPDPAPSNVQRMQLAIGAPGARRGTQGRVGRTWVLDNDVIPRLRDVVVPGAGSPKYGQFGFALATRRDLNTAGARPQDHLVVAAPGVTLGGCGAPALYLTHADAVSLHLETDLRIEPPEPLPPPAFCPQDPNLSDDLDSFPNPVWDATFGAHMVSGDFDGDKNADLAVSGAGKAYVFLGNSLNQVIYKGAVSNTDFGEPSPESSFAVSMATGDLNSDGHDELIIGASLAAGGALPNVGRAYVFQGCVPTLGGTVSPGNFVPRHPLDDLHLALPPALGRALCPNGVRAWFTLRETDFQSQEIRVPQLGVTGYDTVPAYPPFTEERSEDRFAKSIAVIPGGEGTRVTVAIGCPNKGLAGGSRAGAVFRFFPSLTSDAPAFRNQGAVSSEFTTHIRRD